jgi:hypothetical protein
MRTIYHSLLLVTTLTAMLALPTRAQSPAPVATAAAADDDTPGPTVARISLMNGDVSVRRGDSGDIVAGAINAPVMVEDRVSTAPGGRAEIQLDYYNRVRLGSDSDLRLSLLEPHKYQLQIPRGTVIFAALPGTNDQIELATPSASLRPLASGSYRITVYDDGSAEFTVRHGEAEIYTPHGTRKLVPGQTMRVRLGSDNAPEFQIIGEVARDSFDEFSAQRDRELTRTKSYQYMSRDIAGGEDLDSNGTWEYVAPYGYCWRPYVAAGWAPYRYGRWAWEDYYGWTWIGYDSWGWAPYHYGRWFWGGSGWCWYPGMMGMPVFWRPALVGFFGFGPFGIGFGFGSYGWVPLAPFERFHPWYGGGFGRGMVGSSIVRNVNVANTYRNARVEGGVTGLGAQEFRRGGAGAAIPSGSHDLTNASSLHGALPVSPTHSSLQLSDHAANPQLSARMSAGSNRSFVSRQPAATGQRASFEQQRQGLGAGPHSTASATAAARSTTSQGGWPRASSAGGSATSAGRAAASAATGAGTRVGTGSGTGTGASTARSTGEGARGWTNFGSPAATSHGTAGEATGAARTGTGAGTSESSARANGGWGAFGQPARSSAAESGSRGSWSTGGDTSSRGVEGSSSTSSGRSWSSGGGSSYGSGSYSHSQSSAPAQPHYSAPSGGGGSHSSGSGSSHSSGGGHASAPASHSGGGGSHHR